MTDFLPYNSTTHSTVELENDYNNILAHGLEKAGSYILRKNGSYYEAILGGSSTSAGTIPFGGALNAGGIDGTNSTAVFNAAMAAVTAAQGGTIYVKGTRAIPYAITSVSTVTADCAVIGIGEVDWTTTTAGADNLTIGARSRIENLFIHCNATWQHTVVWTEQLQLTDRYYTAFPSAAGAIAGTPSYIFDGDINLEGAGKIAGCTHYWVWDTGTAANKVMIGPENATTIAVRNIADTLYCNFKLESLYFPTTGGYILPLENLYIQTPEEDARSIYLKGWDGSAQLECARILSDTVGNNPTFQIKRGYLTGTLNCDNQYIDNFPTEAASTEAGKSYFVIKLGGVKRRVPCFNDA
jgi:hypothetical protein